MAATMPMTAAKTSPAGNMIDRLTSRAGRRRLGKGAAAGVILALMGASADAWAQTTQPAGRTASGAAVQDLGSSLTVQQIVARQEAHYGQIQNMQGIVVHADSTMTTAGTWSRQELQKIHFAAAGDKSVTLAMPETADRFYSASNGQIPWSQITAATLIQGDTVFTIQKPPAGGGTTQPKVLAVPFNPVVHENNPLVAFHPRQVGDEQMPLRELARAIPQMAKRPVVSDIVVEGRRLLRIDFSNPQTPGEHLYYLIDPAHGYLPVQISRVSNGKPVSVSNILLAPTPQGFWVPARRERITYGPNGQPVTKQNWHYEYVAINQGLASMALTLMYFNLPLSSPVTVVQPSAAAAGTSAPKPAQPAAPKAGQGTTRPAAPTPSRSAAGAPVRVKL